MIFKFKPVQILKHAFWFCKYSVALLLWVALFLKSKELIIVSFLVLLFSAILRIRRAPLVVLYTYTLGKIIKSPKETLDEYGMRFAHSLGALLNLICLILLYFGNESLGWAFVFFVALAKTSGALGYCGGVKLYNCLSKGGCCSFLGKKNNG